MTFSLKLALILTNRFISANSYPRGSKQAPVESGGGLLTIGFDNPGTSAYSYFKREGQDLDVGFIKVLFSAEPVALNSIPQTMIFQDTAPVVIRPEPEERHEFTDEIGTARGFLCDPALVDRSRLLRSTFAGCQNTVHDF